MTQPAEYPSELEDHIRLPNQRLLHIRPLRPCDDGPIRELYSHLSPWTRYLRFLSAMPVLPDSVLSLMMCVDYRRRLALLAELDIADGSEVVALGSFGALDEDAPWRVRGVLCSAPPLILEYSTEPGD